MCVSQHYYYQKNLLKMFRVFILTIVSVLVYSEDNIECEIKNTGEKGICLNFNECRTAIRDLELRIHPQICSFNGTSKIPSICCLGRSLSSRFVPDEPLVPVERTRNETCGKINFRRREPTGKIVGQKAWEKCLEYQSKIDLPCYKGRTVSSPYCGQQLGTQRAGGINADEHEFGHMALLGYGKNFSEATFGCGGSLISEHFVLTAGHCTSTRTQQNVTFAVFGILQRQDVPKVLPENIRQFKRIVKHPHFKPPSVYHDIALLELDTPIQLSYKVRPACLHVGNDIHDIRAYATGWGALGHRGPNADVLQKVPLWRVKNEVCKTKYPHHRVAIRGYDNTTQMCYGDDGIPRDTCKGDSGGPLQISNEDVYCTYLIVGVTSVGLSNCAQVGFPGLYTRVAHYVPWIESVVWP